MPLRQPDRKLTMVAFVRDLDPALLALIKGVWSVAGATPGWLTSFERGLDRLHFTILGLEAVSVDGRLANYHALKNSNRLAWCDYTGLLDLFRLYEPDQLVCSVRMGSYQPCDCHADALSVWRCPSGGIHSFGKSAHLRSSEVGRKLMLTGWPAGGNVTPTFDRALYHLRRRAENWGFHDKYHALERPEWQDDDFYGAIADLSEELYTDRTLLRSLEKAIRDHLAGVAPVIVPVPLSALSV